MPPPALFLRLNQEVRGPFGPDVLADLAQSGVVTPDTEASTDSGGPWIALRMRGDCAVLFPPRRAFRFKAKSFERMNRRPDPAIDVRPDSAPPSSREAAGSPHPANRAPPIDVMDILRDNAQFEARREEAMGLTARSDRRRPACLILLLLVDGFLAWRIVADRSRPLTMLYSLAGLIVVTFGLTWVIFSAKDRR